VVTKNKPGDPVRLLATVRQGFEKRKFDKPNWRMLSSYIVLVCSLIKRDNIYSRLAAKWQRCGASKRKKRPAPHCNMLLKDRPFGVFDSLAPAPQLLGGRNAQGKAPVCRATQIGVTN